MSVHQDHVGSPGAPLLEVPESLELLDRQLLEQMLRDSELHFQSWFEDAPMACQEVDRNGIILCVNQAECEVLGFRAEDMVGRHIWDFMVPKTRPRPKRAF